MISLWEIVDESKHNKSPGEAAGQRYIGLEPDGEEDYLRSGSLIELIPSARVPEPVSVPYPYFKALRSK